MTEQIQNYQTRPLKIHKRYNFSTTHFFLLKEKADFVLSLH